MNNQLIVAGAGGKGGGGGASRAAVEAANTLRSKQIAHIIDLLGEGEWEGLIDGPAGIYLNDVQLFTPASPTGDVLTLDLVDESGAWPYAGTWNFQGVTVEFRAGTQGQSAIKTSATASSAQSVNSTVVHATPITAAITNTNFDLAIVNVQVNSLYQQNTSNGDLSGYYVDLKIEYQTSGGSWIPVVNDRIEGKTMGPYVRPYSIDLGGIPGPWNIRVTRVSEDDATTAFHSEIVFLGLVLQSRDKFRYPNSVLGAIGFDASQVSTIPTRAYDAKMMRCRIPSNYNPVTRAYTGTWDGTFVVAWTDNPPWCLYELATNERFGLGEYFDETLLNKWTLYTVGKYCDELVPDGFGGQEPRFTLNVYLQSADEAITVLQNLASVCRSIIYYAGGELTAVQDAPADPIYAFNRTNVKDGKFGYAGASGSARHTVAMVVWNNPELQYKQDIEYVEDAEAMLRFGYRALPITAIGCTSRGQAHRVGQWALYVEQNESDVITFMAALEGTGVRPGNIIEVYDPDRAGVRLGGRIIDIASNVITVDLGVPLPTGTHTISYIADDGTLSTRTVTVTAGTFTTLTLVGTDPLPSVGSIFGVQTSTVQAQLFRILSIIERGTEYEISGIAHNPGKYDSIEQNLTLEPRPTSVVSMVLPPVAGIAFNEALYLLGDETVGIRLSVSWVQQQFAMGYLVSIRRGTDNWSTERLVTTHDVTIDPVSEGWLYGVRITPISIVGKRGTSTEVSYSVIGEKEPPPPFDYFTCIVQPDGTRQFDFGYTVTEKPIDFKGARIRYFQGVTTNWDDMTPLENEGFFPFSPLETNQLLSGTYTIAARAEDRTKNQSSSVFISVTLPDRRLGNVLVEYDEGEEGWTGTKTSCHVAGDVVEANDSVTWATLPATWAGWTRWNTTPSSPITYTGPVRDLVSTLSVLLDVAVVTDGNVVSEVRWSLDNVTWSAWVTASTPFVARYFQVRLTVTATGPFPIPVIRQMLYMVGGKVKKESINDLNIAALTGAHRIGVGDIRLPLNTSYTAISRVTVMAIQDANPGWTWLLVDRDVTVGPRIKFYKNGVLADPALVDTYTEGY